MGIAGLLSLLRSIQQQKSLSELKGKTLAVDAYVWLHRGAYGCAMEMMTGKPTTRYVDYAMHRIRFMRHHGVEPFLVFDGGPLPAKQGTEEERGTRRREALAKAKLLTQQRRLTEARELYMKCVDITPQHAFQLIKALRAESVKYVVAPYEADAQMFYLELNSHVDGILTEDSDLLVFGAQNAYFKLDINTATVQYIQRSQFAKNNPSELNLSLWGDKEVRWTAMLAGCDYLEGLSGVGVKTAARLLRRYKTVPGVIKAINLGLESSSKGSKSRMQVPKGWLERFQMAELGFIAQRVYDPISKTLVHVRDLELAHGEKWDEERDLFVGRQLPDELVQQIAQGDACPISHEPMIDINPGYRPAGRGKASTSSSSTSSHQHRPSSSSIPTSAFPPQRPAKPAGAPKVASGPMDRFLKAPSSNKPSNDMNGAKAPEPIRIVSRGSGKRTLAGEAERMHTQKMVTKVTATSNSEVTTKTAGGLVSRFFAKPAAVQDNCNVKKLSTMSNQLRPSLTAAQSSGSDEDDGSLVVIVDDDENETSQLQESFGDIPEESVEQEDGYRSPSPEFITISDDEDQNAGDSDESDASSVSSVEEDVEKRNANVGKSGAWSDSEVMTSPEYSRRSKTPMRLSNTTNPTSRIDDIEAVMSPIAMRFQKYARDPRSLGRHLNPRRSTPLKALDLSYERSALLVKSSPTSTPSASPSRLSKTPKPSNQAIATDSSGQHKTEGIYERFTSPEKENMAPDMREARSSTLASGSTILAPDLQGLFLSFEQGDNGNSSGSTISPFISQEGQKIPSSDRRQEDPTTPKRKPSPLQDSNFIDLTSSPSAPLPDVVPESDFDVVAETDLEDLAEQEVRRATVANGWRSRYSLGTTVVSTARIQKRHETTLSPMANRRTNLDAVKNKLLQSAPITLNAQTTMPKSTMITSLSNNDRGKGKSRVEAHLRRKPRKSETLIRQLELLDDDEDDESGRFERSDGRDRKRRRLSTPIPLLDSRFDSIDSNSASLQVSNSDQSSPNVEDIIARSKGRLQAFRFGA